MHRDKNFIARSEHIFQHIALITLFIVAWHDAQNTGRLRFITVSIIKLCR